jgi:NAD(P)H-hydrate epimerase
MTGPFLSRAQVRELDRRAIEEYGVPGVVLMENAGRGAAEVLRRLGPQGPVVICCGKGNNGGDGFVIARHLDNAGVAVRVLLFAPAAELTGDAAVNHQIVARAGLPLREFTCRPLNQAALRQELASAAWIVDALFGTGLRGALGSPWDEIITAINASPAQVLAVDLPSGLDCDTGLPLGPTVRAHHTVTFVALKQGFANPAASAWLGQVHVADIGAPRVLLPTTASAPGKETP